MKRDADSMKQLWNCTRCALEGIKSDLKDYPNHLLTCGKCQWLGKQVGTKLGVAYSSYQMLTNLLRF